MAPSVWLVTGCSSGFGTTFVHEILSRGDKVIATGRNAANKLAHLESTGAAILDLDVTASQATINAKLEEAIAIYGHIDVLVNNAGYVQLGFVEETTIETYHSVFATNFFGAMNVTTALLPHFRLRRTGTIAFMDSIFSWTSGVALAPYAASKHATKAYAESLSAEVSQFGIQVTSFDIGHFRTPALGPERMKVTVATIEDYNSLVEGWTEMGKNMDGNQPGDPERGVRVMVDVLKGEGVAEGRKKPNRLVVGSDAVEIVGWRCKETLRAIEEWKDVSVSTDFEEPKRGFWAEMAKSKV